MEKILTDRVTFIAKHIGHDDDPKEFECTHVLIWVRPPSISVTGDGQTTIRSIGGTLKVMRDDRSLSPGIDAHEIQFTDQAGTVRYFNGRMIAGDVFQFREESPTL